METLELHLLLHDNLCSRMVLAEIGEGTSELMIELYHTLGGIGVFYDGEHLIVEGRQIKYQELIEGTMEKGNYTCFVVDPTDAGWLVEGLTRMHWGISDGRVAICQNFKQGKPLVNRTIYSS